jgi:CheY-like chemotaxis protein
MDMQMPVMSGYEAIEKIRGNKETADYKIIALTAHVNETELKKCIDAGADRYLSKPFVIEDLKKEIHFLIGN